MADLDQSNAPKELTPLAKTSQESAAAVDKGNRGVEETRRSLVQAARSKIKEILAPAPAAEAAKAAPATSEAGKSTSEVVSAAPAAVPTVNPGEVFAKALEERLTQATQARLQAEQSAQTALTEVNRLKELAKNPLEFLKDQKISVDQWHARLANGGAPSAEEQVSAAVNARLADFDRRIAQAEQDAARRVVQAQLPAMLAKDFPLVNARLGADGAVDAVIKAKQTIGRDIDTQHFFRALEKTFKDESDKMAAVLGLTKAEVTAATKVISKADTPTTLTNRTTSSVSGGKQTPKSREEMKAAGRAFIKQLAQAGRL